MHIVPDSEGKNLTKSTGEGIAIHEKAEEMPGLKLGPFVRRSDGAIVCAEGTEAHISRDEGENWSSHPLFREDEEIEISAEGTLLCTRDDVIILAFVNARERHWTWSDELKDAPGARLPTYAIRSLDGGETWQDLQKLHEEWTGAIRDSIETRDGRVVFTTMKMLEKPGRHSVLTYSSDDKGETWSPSNIIDLGGNGNHGGVTEATLVELKDGRLIKYIRTNWEQFWLARSLDDGRSWHPMGPSGVDASSAPGILKRLDSGRIALVWNRLYPQGETSYPLTGGDGIWSATPVSNHREELSISFSDDECSSWSRPVVLARKEGAWLAYPYIFEAAPGQLWVTTMQGDLRASVREEDFIR
jgi:hypothetical protein